MRLEFLRQTASAFAFAFAVMAISSGTSEAGPITQTNQLYVSGTTQFKLTNNEEVVSANGTPLGPNDKITVGDRFIGIFNITSTQTTDGSIVKSPGDFNVNVTGVFETEISAINDNGVTTSLAITPYAPFATELASLANVQAAGGTASNLAGSMTAIFANSPNPPVSYTSSGPVATDIANAEKGSFYASLGGTGTWGKDYYWAGYGADTVAGNSVINSTFAASLQMIFNNTGLKFSDNQTQEPPVGLLTNPLPAPYGPGTSATPAQALAASAALASIVNVVALQGNVKPNPNFPGHSPWPLQSQDPVQLSVIPEPATWLVWLGLGSLGVLARRRNRKSPLVWLADCSIRNAANSRRDS